MAFDIKKTASELLKIADAVEKEASDHTYFVCNECNHTANLTSINRIRNKVASENGVGSVSAVTVNDKIACPVVECEGVMRYAATDQSDKYYIDVESGKEDNPLEDIDLGGEGSPEEESPEEETPAPSDEEGPEDMGGEDTGEEESKFEPVDEQGGSDDEESDIGSPEDEGPDAESPTEELIEEEIEEEKDKDKKPKKKPKKKKDKADDEKAVPKFTEMPEDMKDVKMKTASKRFLSSVARYSNM